MLGYDTTLLSTNIKDKLVLCTEHLLCNYHMSSSKRIACRGGSVYDLTTKAVCIRVPVSIAVLPEFEVDSILTPFGGI